MSKKRKRRNKGANRSQAPQARPAAETGAVRPVATRAAAYEPRPRTAAEEREGAPVYSRAKEAACAMRDQRRAGDAPEAPDAPAPFDYQSDRHCSKTVLGLIILDYMFDYQSDRHCSKTCSKRLCRAIVFDYQSDRHCSKTAIGVSLCCTGFDYQSDRHCSKT